MSYRISDDELKYEIRVLIAKSTFGKFDALYREILIETKRDLLSLEEDGSKASKPALKVSDALPIVSEEVPFTKKKVLKVPSIRKKLGNSSEESITVTKQTDTADTPIGIEESIDSFQEPAPEPAPTKTTKIVKVKNKYFHMETARADPEKTSEKEPATQEVLSQEEKDKELHENYWKTQVSKAKETSKKLQKEGKKLKDVLTKENLTKWLIEDGLSYSVIARDYAGCPNSVVSDYAKKFGLMSQQASAKKMKNLSSFD